MSRLLDGDRGSSEELRRGPRLARRGRVHRGPRRESVRNPEERQVIGRRSRPPAGWTCRRAPRRHRLVVELTVAVVAAGCGGGSPPILPPGGAGTAQLTSSGEREWALELLSQTNSIRAEAGLEPLSFDERAASAAYEHTVDMD